ncbi:MAG: hypothetical protein QFX35_00375 [Candidatus Verstraetearchaeota archaeon]|nr:hypothetical protein [Candidatus Verstraetearchaeota archaeon]
MLVYIALFGALSIVLTSLRVSFPLGNPNLGSTAVSVVAVASPGLSAFAVGLIKGVGASLWTGQAIIEIPAGIGDGMMGLLTSWLSRRKNPAIAVVVGQLSRYVFTSGMISLSLSIFQSNLYPSFIAAWHAMIPAITLSIVGNALISLYLVQNLHLFTRSIQERF